MVKLNERHRIVRRLLKVMTKEELAAKLKVSIFSVLRWQSGDRNPSYATFYLLQELYKKVKK